MGLAKAGGADFARFAMIGRHELGIPRPALEKFFRERGRPDLPGEIASDPGDGYCESLLGRAFGSQVINSIDYSEYENASIIHDMNTPITGNEKYGVVADFGTLEHIFNAPVALDNLVRLCAPQGRILHISPCNNFVGHGFYQFSPELFFQLYSKVRGFADTRIFLTPALPMETWYEVASPSELKSRVNVTSRDQILILVMTTMTGTPPSLLAHPVQQSDYMNKWDNQSATRNLRETGLKSFVKRVRRAFPSIVHRHKVRRKDVARRSRKDIRRVNVLSLAPNF